MKKIRLLMLCFVLLLGVQYSQAQIWDGLLLHYTFNNQVKDLGPFDFAGAISGAQPVPDRFGNARGALYFDGVDDYVTIPHSDTLKTELPVSFSLWLYVEDIASSANYYIMNIDGGADVYHGYSLNFANDGSGTLAVSYGTGGGIGHQFRRTTLGSIPLNSQQWHHVVGVIRGAEDMDIYVDGVKDTDLTHSGTSNSDPYFSDEPGMIGKNPHTEKYFNGAMDDLYYWDRALSEDEVQELFAEDRLLLHYPVGEDLADASWYHFDAIPDGPVPANDRFGNENSSLYFDGVDDVVHIPHDDLLKQELPVSFSCWVYLMDSSSINNYLFNIDGTSTGGYQGYSMTMYSPNGESVLSMHYGTGNCYGHQCRRSLTGSIPLSSKKWHHVVGVIRGKTDMELYIDGILDTAAVYNGTSNFEPAFSTSEGIMGFNPYSTDRYLHGAIDDFRYWNKSLDHSEVLDLYQPGTTDDLGTVTSLNRYDFVADVRLSPNPAEDQLRLTGADFERIWIYDIAGKLLLQTPFKNELDISSLPKGMLLIQLEDENQLMSQALKLIKQ